MVPAAAQRFRDRAAKGVGTVVSLHRDYGIVSKGFARHGDDPSPAAAQSALQRRQYVEHEVATGRHRVEQVTEGCGEVPVANPGDGAAASADDLGQEIVARDYGGLVESGAGVEDGGIGQAASGASGQTGVTGANGGNYVAPAAPG
jgi:hypothetical protein